MEIDDSKTFGGLLESLQKLFWGEGIDDILNYYN